MLLHIFSIFHGDKSESMQFRSHVTVPWAEEHNAIIAPENIQAWVSLLKAAAAADAWAAAKDPDGKRPSGRVFEAIEAAYQVFNAVPYNGQDGGAYALVTSENIMTHKELALHIHNEFTSSDWTRCYKLCRTLSFAHRKYK
jgi:hypothetical protein